MISTILIDLCIAALFVILYLWFAMPGRDGRSERMPLKAYLKKRWWLFLIPAAFFVAAMIIDDLPEQWITDRTTSRAADDTYNVSATQDTTAVKTYWTEDDGKWHYWRNGENVTGWVEDDGEWYYLLAYEYGMARNRWIDGFYYLGDDGKMLHDCTRTIGGETYTFSESGRASFPDSTTGGKSVKYVAITKDISYSFDATTATLTISGEGKWKYTNWSESQFPQWICESTEKLIISEGIENIPKAEFSGDFKNLRTVTVGEGVKEIGDNAFRGSKALEEVWLPKSLDETGEGIFAECESLTDIHFAGTLEQWWSLFLSSDDYNGAKLDLVK